MTTSGSRGRGRAQRVGIREVAASAGVAVSSVSRVLGGHPDVSDDMRTRVEHAVRETGYEPNVAAQTLRSGRSMSVGFVVGDISNPLMASIGLAAGTGLADHGYTLLLASSRGTAAAEVANLQVFRQRHVDGLMASITDESNEVLHAELRRFDVPVVLLDRQVEAVPSASAVLFDHRGFTAAAEHLLSLGHRHLALIAGSEHVRTTRERVRAVRAVVSAAGSARLTVRLGTLSREQGRGAAEDVLAVGDRPTAIICGGNQLLPGVLEALRARGLLIPADVSVVTTDSADLAQFHQPVIGTVTRDPHELGRVAAEILLQRMNGESAGPPVTLATAFDPGGSCAPPS